MIDVSVNSSLHFLVTGGAGFIGSHLCEALLKAGHHVTVLDNLSTGTLRNLAASRSSDRFSFQEGSVLDVDRVQQLVATTDVVVHLAAALGVQRILRQPVETLEVNVLGTHHVLQAAQAVGCRVLIASTSEVYGKGYRVPFAEDDDIVLGSTSRSRWGYATSKMLDEFMALAYHEEHGLDAVVFRLFNTAGPRQASQYGMVLPRLVQQALLGEPLTIYGDGGQSRCFCHVADVIRAIMALSASKEASGRVFNIGSTEEITIEQLARKILAQTGSSSPLTYIPYSAAYPPGFEDMRQRIPDISRIGRLLGWQPQCDLHEIIATVIEHEQQVLRDRTLCGTT